MDLLHPDVQQYLEASSTHNDPILLEMESRAAQDGFPIIGPVAGRFCSQVALMVGARRIFELGSGYGYSTLWFAKSVAELGGGEVHHTVWDEGLSKEAQQYLDRAGMTPWVRFRVSEAVAALKEAPGTFDVIFNDINKEGYPASLPVIKEKLRPGGVLIADNVLWSGMIFDPADRSAATQGIRDFTRQVLDDPDFLASIVPLRDGLLVAVKRHSG